MINTQFVQLTACFLATVGLVTTTLAQPPAPSVDLTPIPMGTIGDSESISGPIFRDTQFGDYPHYGENGSPGVGYPHQELRGIHYGLWYRPNSFHGYRDWSCPKKFNPRGYGTPQQNSHYKLDYAPAVVHFPETHYGPYYYPRFESYKDVPRYGEKSIWYKLWNRD